MILTNGNRDFDSPVVIAVRMLNVHPGSALIRRVKVEAGKLRSHRPVRRPSRQALARIGQITVSVEVPGEPDIVIAATGPVLDDVDIAIMVDRQVVRAA